MEKQPPEIIDKINDTLTRADTISDMQWLVNDRVDRGAMTRLEGIDVVGMLMNHIYRDK